VRHREVYVRKNPGIPYKQDHETASINLVREGVGMVRTALIDDSVLGKRRKEPECDSILVTPIFSCCSSLLLSSVLP
jgi:hypothetical protein